MKAMLLAAGLGTRMAPLTRHWPKPALPVLDRSLLERHLETFAELGIERAIVNVHAHPHAIRRAAQRASLPVEISVEPELLGSGGGIGQARRWLAGPEPFLVVNADMRVEYALAPLLDTHRRLGASITLLLRDDPGRHDFGSIGYGIEGLVCRITDRYPRSPNPNPHSHPNAEPVSKGGPTGQLRGMESPEMQSAMQGRTQAQTHPTESAAEAGRGLFTGVQIMSGDVFAHFPPSGPCELVPEVWIPLLERGGRIAAVAQSPTQRWEPVGTPAELLESNLRALREAPARERRAPDARTLGEIREPVWIGAGARIDAGARVGPDVVIGSGARVSTGCALRNALVLPGAELAPDTVLERGIAFEREVWLDA